MCQVLGVPHGPGHSELMGPGETGPRQTDTHLEGSVTLKSVVSM